MSVFLVQCNMVGIEMFVSMIIHQKQYKVQEILCRKISRKNGIEIQIQHWGGNRKLSMERIAVEYFPNSTDTGSN